jgi:hypothetical protein
MAKHPPTLTITVDESGAVSTDFTHFLGQECLAAGQQLHALLAEYGLTIDVTAFTPKPELLFPPPSGGTVAQEEGTQEGERA